MLGFGCLYLLGFGGNADIIGVLCVLLFGVVGICLFLYGIYTLVTGKECKVVEVHDEKEKQRELTEEERQKVDMFIGEHGDKVEKVKDAVYTIGEIGSIIRDILLG